MNLPKPPWLKKRLPPAGSQKQVTQGLRARNLHTICAEASCPNRGECYSQGVATFLIMGDVCTRNCSFCAVKSGQTQALDPEEPGQVAAGVKKLGLNFVVITQPKKTAGPKTAPPQHIGKDL